MRETTHGPASGQPTDRAWRDRAACRGVDPELFFPIAESGPVYEAQVGAAKWVCARCPVREPCLAEALARIPYGIAGGLTEQERLSLRRAGGPGAATAGAATAAEVPADGPPRGMKRRERTGVGQSLPVADRTSRQLTGDDGITPHSIRRWARTPPDNRTTGTAEGSHGGNRTPLLISTAHDTQAGTRAPEGIRE